jgi:hypothetical protein
MDRRKWSLPSLTDSQRQAGTVFQVSGGSWWSRRDVLRYGVLFLSYTILFGLAEDTLAAQDKISTHLELQFSYADATPREISSTNIKGWATAIYPEACRTLPSVSTSLELCPTFPSEQYSLDSFVPLWMLIISFDQEVYFDHLYTTFIAPGKEPRSEIKWFDRRVAVIVMHGNMTGVRVQIRAGD